MAVGTAIGGVFGRQLVAWATFRVLRAMKAAKRKEEEQPSPPPERAREERFPTELRDLLAQKEPRRPGADARAPRGDGGAGVSPGPGAVQGRRQGRPAA